MSFPLFGSMCADGPFLPYCCQLATRSHSPSPVTTRDFWHLSQTREPTPHICVIVRSVSPSVTHHLMLFGSSSNSYHATCLRSCTWTVPGSGLTSPAFLQPTIHASQYPVNCCLGLSSQFKSSWLAWLPHKCKALDCHFVYKIMIIFIVAFHFITNFVHFGLFSTSHISQSAKIFAC